MECVIAEQNNIIESHNEKWKAILQHISKPHGENGRCFFFLRLLFSVFVYCKGKKETKGKERKETLFKCQGYLALRHINWGHCKLKLIQIKLNQMQVFEEKGKLEYPGENLSE